MCPLKIFQQARYCVRERRGLKKRCDRKVVAQRRVVAQTWIIFAIARSVTFLGRGVVQWRDRKLRRGHMNSLFLSISLRSAKGCRAGVSARTCSNLDHIRNSTKCGIFRPHSGIRTWILSRTSSGVPIHTNTRLSRNTSGRVPTNARRHGCSSRRRASVLFDLAGRAQPNSAETTSRFLHASTTSICSSALRQWHTAQHLICSMLSSY